MADDSDFLRQILSSAQINPNQGADLPPIPYRMDAQPAPVPAAVAPPAMSQPAPAQAPALNLDNALDSDGELKKSDAQSPLADDALKQTMYDQLRQKYNLYNDDARQKVLDENKADASGPNWRAVIAALGAGIAGQDAAGAGGQIQKMQQAQRQAKIDQFDQSKANVIKDIAVQNDADANSPTSRQSQVLQKQIKRLYGDKFSDDDIQHITAADAPMILKPLELDAQVQARKEAAAARIQQAQMAGEEKRSKAQDQMLTSTQQALEQMRGSPAVSQAEKDIYAAQKATTLAKQFQNPTQAQVKLLASEIGKIAQGGQPTTHELEGITPNTLTGRLSSVYENLTNNPTPANAQAFVKQYMDYAGGVTKDAQQVIKDRYGRIIEPRRSLLGPSNSKMLDDQYTSRFNQDVPTPSHGASSKPKSVMQNGHTYILNEQTGEYE